MIHAYRGVVPKVRPSDWIAPARVGYISLAADDRAASAE
jgi:hypothetical protein